MRKSSFSRLDVLVVDSSQHMTALLAQMLRQLRVHSVTEAHDSLATLQRLEHNTYAVMILADDLAPMDGVALTRALRATPDSPNRDMAVIMMASAPSASLIADARDAGITEFLKKPFAAQHVATRLESILRAPRAFVEAEGYAGPDRRRRAVEREGGERRTRS